MTRKPIDPALLRQSIARMVQSIQDKALADNARREMLTSEDRAEYEWLCLSLYTEQGFDMDASNEMLKRYYALEAKLDALTRLN